MCDSYADGHATFDDADDQQRCKRTCKSFGRPGEITRKEEAAEAVLVDARCLGIRQEKSRNNRRERWSIACVCFFFGQVDYSFACKLISRYFLCSM